MDTLEKRAELLEAMNRDCVPGCEKCRRQRVRAILSALTDAREEGKRAQTEGLLGTAASGASVNKSTPGDEPLTCKVVDRVLTIRIGVDVLAHAFMSSPVRDRIIWDEARMDHDQSRCIVVDPDEFASDVRREVIREREDGSSKLTDMIDKACLAAVEDGSLGVSDSDEWEGGDVDGGASQALSELDNQVNEKTAVEGTREAGAVRRETPQT